MEGMLAGEPWNHDAITVPLPWRKNLASPAASRPLRIGFYFDDGYVRVQPPMELAARKAVEALRAAGHDCALLAWSSELCLHTLTASICV